MSRNDAVRTAEPDHVGGELVHADADHVASWLTASVLEATGLELAEQELEALAAVCALDWNPTKTNAAWRHKRGTGRDKFEAGVRRLAKRALEALKETVLDVDEVADALSLLIDAQLDRRATPTVEPPGASAGCDASGAADEGAPQEEVSGAPQEEVAGDASFAMAEEALRRQLLARGEARLRGLDAPKKGRLTPSKSGLGLDGMPLSASWTVKLVSGRAGRKYLKGAAPRGRTAPRPADWDSANEDSADESEGDDGCDGGADEAQNAARPLPAQGSKRKRGKSAEARLGAKLGVELEFTCNLCTLAVRGVRSENLASHRLGPRSCIRSRKPKDNSRRARRAPPAGPPAGTAPLGSGVLAMLVRAQAAPRPMKSAFGYDRDGLVALGTGGPPSPHATKPSRAAAAAAEVQACERELEKMQQEMQSAKVSAAERDQPLSTKEVLRWQATLGSLESRRLEAHAAAAAETPHAKTPVGTAARAPSQSRVQQSKVRSRLPAPSRPGARHPRSEAGCSKQHAARDAVLAPRREAEAAQRAMPAAAAPAAPAAAAAAPAAAPATTSSPDTSDAEDSAGTITSAWSAVLNPAPGSASWTGPKGEDEKWSLEVLGKNASRGFLDLPQFEQETGWRKGFSSPQDNNCLYGSAAQSMGMLHRFMYRKPQVLAALDAQRTVAHASLLLRLGDHPPAGQHSWDAFHSKATAQVIYETRDFSTNIHIHELANLYGCAPCPPPLPSLPHCHLRPSEAAALHAQAHHCRAADGGRAGLLQHGWLGEPLPPGHGLPTRVGPGWPWVAGDRREGGVRGQAARAAAHGRRLRHRHLRAPRTWALLADASPRAGQSPPQTAARRGRAGRALGAARRAASGRGGQGDEAEEAAVRR